MNQISTDRKLALLVADISGPRVCKIGYALKSIGWRVILLHRDQLTLGNPRGSFHETIRFEAAQEALQHAEILDPDIIHVFSCWDFEVAGLLIREIPAKIVFDDYDVIAGMVKDDFARSAYPDLLETERFCLENAAGVCCRSLETQYARHRLGYNIRGTRVFFQDYCWGGGIDFPPRHPGHGLQIAYCGNIAAEKEFPNTRRRSGFFLELAEDLAKSGIHLHLFPSEHLMPSFDESFSDHLELARQTPYFHLHRALPPDLLISAMSQFDFGVHSSWHEEWSEEVYCPEKYALATSNKLFDYLDAGLAVAIDERAFQRRMIMRLKAGIVSYHEELPSVLRALPGHLLNSLRANAIRAREIYSVRRHIHRLERMYLGIAAGPVRRSRSFVEKGEIASPEPASPERIIADIKNRSFPGSSFIGPYEKSGVVAGVREEQWLWRHRDLIRGSVLDMSTPRYWHSFIYDLPSVSEVIISDLSENEVSKLDQISPVDIIGDFCATPPPLPAGSLDTILCLSIIEHCADPFSLVRNMSSLLRPDGVLFLLAPFAYIDGHLNPDYWRFGRDGFRFLAARADLEIVAEGSFGDLGKYSYPEFGFDASARGEHRGIPCVTWIICRKPQGGPAARAMAAERQIRLYAGDIPDTKEYNGWLGLSLTRQDERHIRHDITDPLPFADNSVDAFQAEDVFEHIPYDRLVAVVDEIHRILKPGALFRLSVPDYGCDVLRERSALGDAGEIIFDPGGGGTPEDPGHLWFPRIDTVNCLVARSSFAANGAITFLHYWNMDDATYAIHPIDYEKGMVMRTPDFDDRVRDPRRPMSIVVDLIKK